jgi:DNA polymerase III psi subunit
MGIPVWEFRTTNDDATISQYHDPLSVQNIEALDQCQCWVMTDVEQQNVQAQRLLHAILFSMGLNSQQFCSIEPSHFAQLNTVDTENKVLIIFGEHLAKNALEETIVRGKLHKPAAIEGLTMLLTDSLDNLLINPQLKSSVWHDLQPARKQLAAQ